MNELVAQTIFERADAGPGIFADYSKSKDKPEFYAKCPKCSVVHGMYPSYEKAVEQQICGTCKFEAIEKYKKELEKDGQPVKQKPGQKKKLPWPLQIESVEGEEGQEEFQDPKDYLEYTFSKLNWIEAALIDLGHEISENITFDEARTNSHSKEGYDPEYPDDMSKFIAVGDRTHDTFAVYKNESDLREEVIERVANEIMESPENFNTYFIKSYFDEERLKQALLQDSSEDPETFDPWDYLEDLYGDSYIKEASQIAPISEEKAREAAELSIRSDGLGVHAAADGRIIYLGHPCVAVQI